MLTPACQWCGSERPATPGICPHCHRFPNMNKPMKTITYKVHMLANNPPEWENPRKVAVPSEEVVSDTMKLLEAIYIWGQNENQPRECCSVSMGDVAEVDGKFYICQSIGWKEISKDELAEYKAIPQRDRSWSEFVRPR